MTHLIPAVTCARGDGAAEPKAGPFGKIHMARSNSKSGIPCAFLV